VQLPVQYQINYSNNEGNLFDSLPGGDYYITLRDAAGCFADTLINLPLKFFIPTGISPNGDNINDTWVIPGLNEYPDCVVTIYNQWGSLIFSSKGYQEVWDGSYQGSKLPSANYYYTIDLGKGNEPLTGKITLAR
jgi:gliding motility-associated-like protein